MFRNANGYHQLIQPLYKHKPAKKFDALPYLSKTVDEDIESVKNFKDGHRSVSQQQIHDEKSHWEFKPDELDFINTKMPTNSEFRKRSFKNINDALTEIRNGFKQNIEMRKMIKEIKHSTKHQM